MSAERPQPSEGGWGVSVPTLTLSCFLEVVSVTDLPWRRFTKVHWGLFQVLVQRAVCQGESRALGREGGLSQSLLIALSDSQLRAR